MTEPQSRSLVDDIEAAVRRAPGVTGVFPAGSTISKMVDLGARALGVRDPHAPLILIERSSEIEVAIGVHSSAGAVESSRRVHVAIDAVCRAHGFTPAEIRVTVVHIDDTPGENGEPS